MSRILAGYCSIMQINQNKGFFFFFLTGICYPQLIFDPENIQHVRLKFAVLYYRKRTTHIQSLEENLNCGAITKSWVSPEIKKKGFNFCLPSRKQSYFTLLHLPSDFYKPLFKKCITESLWDAILKTTAAAREALLRKMVLQHVS